MTSRVSAASRWFCIFLTCCLSVSCGVGEQELVLRLDPEIGSTRTASIEDAVSMEMSTPMGALTMTIDGQTRLEFEVLAVDETGNLEMVSTFDRLQMDMGMEAGGMDLGAMMPLGEFFDSIGDATKGKSFTFMVTPLGIVTEIEGAEELQEAVFSDLEVPPMMQGQGMEDALSEERLMETVQAAFAQFPEGPVPDSEEQGWSSKIQTSGGSLPVMETRTWKKGEELESFVTLEFTSTIQSEEQDAEAVMGMEDVSVTGLGEGRMEVEKDTGWVVDGSRDSTMDGSVEMEGGMIPGSGKLKIRAQAKQTVKTY